MLSDGGALGRPAEELGGRLRELGGLDSPSDIMKPASLEAAIVAAILGGCVWCTKGKSVWLRKVVDEKR
jgi:hypothetical protein